MLWTPKIRQLFVVVACQLSGLSAGGSIGYPMVLLQQLRGDDSPIQLDVESSSWIGALHGLAGSFSVLMPSFMQWQDRRSAFIVSTLFVTIGWLIAYCANSIFTILLSELISGIGTNCLYFVGFLSMSEMTSPKYRNISIQTFSIVRSLGMAISGIAASSLHMKYLCLVMLVPIFISLVMAFFWPESPSWLACKGRFDETYTTFKQLRNMDDSAKRELEELIAAQKENLLRQNRKQCSLVYLRKKISRRDFYMPVIHIFFLLDIIYWSGEGVVICNSFEVIQKVTLSEKAAILGGILVNVALFFGMLLGSILNKRFDNKTVFKFFSICSSVTLFAVFVTTLLQSLDVIPRASDICMYLFVVYVSSNSIGVVPIVYTITSEIMPVKHRGIGGAIFTILNSLLFASSFKISPYLFEYINVWGTFLLYTLNSVICLVVIWGFVPETKNKTLQEIEDFYMFGKFGERSHCDDKICIAE